MDDEKFELMYRFPGEEQHLSLACALDHLFYLIKQMEEVCQDLTDLIHEQNDKIETLTTKVDNIRSKVDTF